MTLSNSCFSLPPFTPNSASCRRPIKGAAGRPLELSDFRMEESFSSKYIPKYLPLADVKSEKTKKGRSIPMWIKILLFVVVAFFLFLVYQAMETNQGNPFYKFLSNDSKKVNWMISLWHIQLGLLFLITVLKKSVYTWLKNKKKCDFTSVNVVFHWKASKIYINGLHSMFWTSD